MTEHFEGGGDKTVIKLQTLNRYLWTYTTIVGEYWNKFWYVDTHSGSGMTWLPRYGVEVDGSAVRAIENYGDKFDRFYLYENDPEHFELLIETLENRFDLSFFRREPSGSRPFTKAGCNDPWIRVFQTDCNEGVPWLVEESGGYAHWLVFIDPARITHLNKGLMKALVSRGNTDILTTCLTSGMHRAGSADHAEDSVARMGGEEYEANSLDDGVRWYRGTIEELDGYETISRKTFDEHDKRSRLDLVFASTSDAAISAMNDIFTSPNLRDDITEEISEVRKDNGQQGLESYDFTFIDPDADSSQSGLSDF